MHYCSEMIADPEMSEITNFRGETLAPDPDSRGEAAVRALILRVGERVRKARELKGIPRRVLSEVSGVSPRYLALLEAGDGNISIGLLQRVADALDHRIEWLVGEDDPGPRKRSGSPNSTALPRPRCARRCWITCCRSPRPRRAVTGSP